MEALSFPAELSCNDFAHRIRQATCAALLRIIGVPEVKNYARLTKRPLDEALLLSYVRTQLEPATAEGFILRVSGKRVLSPDSLRSSGLALRDVVFNESAALLEGASAVTLGEVLGAARRAAQFFDFCSGDIAAAASEQLMLLARQASAHSNRARERSGGGGAGASSPRGGDGGGEGWLELASAPPPPPRAGAAAWPLAAVLAGGALPLSIHPSPDMPVERVVLLMGAKRGDADVAEAGALSLSDILERSGSGAANTAAVALRHGAAKELVAALVAHGGAAGVAASAARALSALAVAGEGARDAVEGEGAVAALVGALKLHDGTPAVAYEALLALTNVVSGEGAPRRGAAAAAAGAPAAAVGAMTHHAGDALLAEAAAALLRNLSFPGASSGGAACLAAGALAPLVGALHAHEASPHVAYEALAALTNLTAGGGAARSAVSAGAHRSAVAALRAHAGSARVAEAAASVLGNLAEVGAGEGGGGGDGGGGAGAEVVAGGGVAALVRVLGAHRGVPGACEAASRALYNLARSSDAHRDACVAGDAVPALVGALEAAGGAPAAAGAAAKALAALVAGHEHAREAAGCVAGGVPALVSALGEARAHPRASLHIVEALAALVCRDGGGSGSGSARGAPARTVDALLRKTAVAAGAVPALTIAWAAHGALRPAAGAALEALGYDVDGRASPGRAPPNPSPRGFSDAPLSPQRPFSERVNEMDKVARVVSPQRSALRCGAPRPPPPPMLRGFAFTRARARSPSPHETHPRRRQARAVARGAAALRHQAGDNTEKPPRAGHAAHQRGVAVSAPVPAPCARAPA